VREEIEKGRKREKAGSPGKGESLPRFALEAGRMKQIPLRGI